MNKTMRQKVTFTTYLKTADKGDVKGAYRDFNCEGILLAWGVNTDTEMGSWSTGIIEIQHINLEGQELVKKIKDNQIFNVPVENIVFHYDSGSDIPF